ncbi:MAG: DUF1573 domain-containing protein [Ignavibacteria bacterium]|nr:DUF1573 domain-containing protein [Ignavibacteria bacterium]MBK7576047.1 DUF1573 domain-containing protein [Ignavibacteria bacterium]MBK9182508.1 DUF1573 domain-containing protein [Ignavibacteria bacterium]MBP6509099.1 DUF1573 domain-containing protein [Candidatus Kapabacteria bacterium]MBP7092753.1 DUF1573 domain-containing protein [Candidatus Kapabacteria bacterium]
MRIIIVTLCLGMVSAIITHAQAKLEVVGGETFDWGRVKPPASGHLDAEIRMKNVGDAPLKITDVHPGCGCTKTDPDKLELAPGEVSTMQVQLSVFPSLVGSVRKNIEVSWIDATSSDTSEKKTTIWLTAFMYRVLVVHPMPFINFVNLQVGTESESIVLVENNSDEDIKLYDWFTDNGITCNYRDAVILKSKEKLELVAKLTPKKVGGFTGMVKVKTSHPDLPILELPAYGTAR